MSSIYLPLPLKAAPLYSDQQRPQAHEAYFLLSRQQSKPHPYKKCRCSNFPCDGFGRSCFIDKTSGVRIQRWTFFEVRFSFFLPLIIHNMHIYLYANRIKWVNNGYVLKNIKSGVFYTNLPTRANLFTKARRAVPEGGLCLEVPL